MCLRRSGKRVSRWLRMARKRRYHYVLIGCALTLIMCSFFPKPENSRVLRTQSMNSKDASLKIHSPRKFYVQPVKVVIMGYMRGGTTFMGELFNQDPAVFYWFEPLASPWDTLYDRYNGYVDNYANGTMRSFPRKDVELFSDIVHQALNCDFDNMDIRPLTHQFIIWWRKSKKTHPYGACVDNQMKKRQKNARKDKIPPEVVRKCVPTLKAICESMPVRVLKTIRMPGYILKQFFADYNDEKIIYYVRDPRPILMSRQSFGLADFSDGKTLRRQSYELCHRFVQDKSHTDDLVARHPGSIKTVKYERLATSPETVSKEIYDFIGREIPEVVRRWLLKNTRSSKDDGAMGTMRNSSATANKWLANRKFVKALRRSAHASCTEALKVHGYSTSY